MENWEETGMDRKTLRCPSCFDVDAIRRSHSRLRDVPLRLIGMRAYRCLQCYRRFYAWKHPIRVRGNEVAGSKVA